jgi:tetratricopeptide (TPR) repeat protein
MSSQSQHVDPETLAAFAEGRLDAATRDAVVAHIDHCDDCLNDIALVMPTAAAESERRRFGRPAWLLALAAALVLAVALPVVWRGMRNGSPTDQLVALAPRSARIVEPRLTGGFPWAAYHGPMRAAGGSATDAQRLKLGGAAGELMQRAEHDPGAEAQHAAGVAMVLVEKPDEAIAKLESAARASHDAKSWSDLAAARYAAAVQFRRPSLYPEALAASDDALRIDDKLPEALFNRALILENMGLISEARKAWQRYLEVDPGSQWANEARGHLAELPATTGASRWERDQPLLEAAAASGDTRKTLALVDTYRERARRFAEADYLGRWADAVQKNNDAEAAKWLTISRGIGTALAQLSGESLLRDAIRAIDNADAHTRAKIAEAHVVYRRGRIAFSRNQAEAAERDLRSASSIFASANDPMSLISRHYASAASLARNDIAAAHRELTRLLADADSHPEYLALRGIVRWELVRAVITNGDRSSQIQMLTAAAELFHRAGERLSETDAQTALAIAHDYFGHPDEAWAARIQSFQALSGMAETAALERTVEEAVHTELKAGRAESALGLSNVAEALNGPHTAPLVAIENLLQKAMLESMTGQIADGIETTKRAEEIAAHLPDSDVRAFQLADIDTARGALLVNTDPRNAAISLTRSIDFYRSRSRIANLPEPLLLRARCEARGGNTNAAALDLEEGIAAIEQYPVRVEGVVLGTYVLNAGAALFADAVRLHLNRGSKAESFG